MAIFNAIPTKLKPKLQEKTVTENGEYTADEGFDGLSKVVVAVPVREPTQSFCGSVLNGDNINGVFKLITNKTTLEGGTTVKEN